MEKISRQVEGNVQKRKLTATAFFVLVALFIGLFINQDRAYADTPEPGYTYHIFPEANINYNLDIPGQSSENALQVNIWWNNNTIAQDFEIRYSGDFSQGAYWFYIYNFGSRKALDVRWAECYPGAVVQQYDLNGTDAQKWTFVYIETVDYGTYSYSFWKIVPKLNPSFCLDVYEGRMANGTGLIVYPYTGGANQKFGFNPTNGVASGHNNDYYFVNGKQVTGFYEGYLFAPNDIYPGLYFSRDGRFSYTNQSTISRLTKEYFYLYTGGSFSYGVMLKSCELKYYNDVMRYTLIIPSNGKVIFLNDKD